jgi:hypothetical protein
LAEAIATLEQADTSHAAVATALTDLRRQRADLERREREQRDQDEKRVQARKSEIAALLKRARKAKSPDTAIALLRSVLELDPDNADAQDALAKYQEQRKGRAADADGTASPSRSKSLWTIGGAASVLVALVVVGYVVRNRPAEQPPAVAPGAVPTTVPIAPAAPTTTVPAAAPLPPTTIPVTTTIPRPGERGMRGSQPDAVPGAGQKPLQPPPEQRPAPTVPVTSSMPTTVPTW